MTDKALTLSKKEVHALEINNLRLEDEEIKIPNYAISYLIIRKSWLKNCRIDNGTTTNRLNLRRTLPPVPVIVDSSTLKDCHLDGVNLLETSNGSVFSDCSFSLLSSTGGSLTDTIFQKCSFKSCSLSGASLFSTSFDCCTFVATDFFPYIDIFSSVTQPIADSDSTGFTNTLPEKCSFIGYKRCANNRIVELEICADAKRLSRTGNKCRCSKAKVLSISNAYDPNITYDTADGIYQKNFTYRVGETVEPDGFDEDIFTQCGQGIHFFLTREQAINF